MLRRLAVVAALAASLLGSAAAPALAAEPTSSNDPVASIVAKLQKTGHISTPDRHLLVTQYPQVAAQLVDPDRSDVAVTDTAQPTGATPRTAQPTGALLAAGAWSCGYVDVWITKYTFLGYVAFRFHQVVGRCWDGTNVTQIYTRYSYVNSVDGQFIYDGLVSDAQWGLWTYKYTSVMQGRFENCLFRYGCIANYYPYVQIRLYGWGTYGYSTSV